jgi:hypothetical protein
MLYEFQIGINKNCTVEVFRTIIGFYNSGQNNIGNIYKYKFIENLWNEQIIYWKIMYTV